MIQLQRIDDTNGICTVALPVWRMRDIAWLQLESLCRQENAGEWELIVSECEGHFALKEARERMDRLHAAGMSSFRYIHNEKRIPLGLKWRQIARYATGDAFLLCAGDNYSPPNRIALSRHYIGVYDWFDVSSGLFYDIATRETGQWVRRDKFQSGLWMATKTKYMRELGDNPPASSIDGWIKQHLPNNMEWMQLPGPLNGLHTDGKNTISKHRSSLYNAGPGHKNFRSSQKQDILSCIPQEVFERLCTLQY